MRYFFIDTENVQKYSFIEEMQLNQNDKIIMFISQNSKNIRVEDLKRFTICKSEIEYEDIYIGESNAMDFQIITYLALIIGRSEEKQNQSYFIVSNDNGFNIPAKYIKDRTGVDVSVLKVNNVSSLATIPVKDDSSKEIIKIIKKSRNLCDFHNIMRMKFGNEKGKLLYKQYKDRYNAYISM